jgi:hypothetical protein
MFAHTFLAKYELTFVATLQVPEKKQKYKPDEPKNQLIVNNLLGTQ